MQTETMQQPTLPGILMAVQMNFEAGYTLVIDMDKQKAKFEGMDPKQLVEFEDALDMQKALGAGEIKQWFDATYPGQLVVIAGGERQVSGAPPALKRKDRPAVPGATCAAEKPAAAFELVTPAMAAQWLEFNVSNRPLDKSLVRRYVSLIKSKGFKVTGDAIQFDRDGRLINGQHRLSAIVASKQAQQMLVARGLDPDVFKVLDYGKRRSPADALAIEGFINSRNLAALCKLICAWMAGKLESITKISVEPQHIVDIAYAFDAPGAHETASGAVRYAHGLYPKYRQLLPLSFVSFVYWAYARLGEDEKNRITDFVQQLATGIGITDEASPVALLRSKLIDDALSEKKLPAFIRFGFTIQAARLHMAGEKAAALNWKGSYPEPGIAPAFGALNLIKK